MDLALPLAGTRDIPLMTLKRQMNRCENNMEQLHKTTTNGTKLDGTPNLGGRGAHSTTFTANTEVHGGHQAWARVTVQLLDLATSAELWRRLERQEG